MRLLQRAGAAGMPSVGADLSLVELHALYADDRSGTATGTFVRANMVVSVDGAVSIDGVSAGLSGRADKDVFAVLRSLSDVILVGAETARTEKYGPARIRPALAKVRAERGHSLTPRIGVVSRSLDLDLDSELMNDASTLVITSGSSDSAKRNALQKTVDVVVAGDREVDLLEALEVLRHRGLHQVLCEGGPTLLGALAASDAMDELCVTLAPKMAGGRHAGLLGSATGLSRTMLLEHVLTADDFLFMRYRVQRDEERDKTT